MGVILPSCQAHRGNLPGIRLVRFHFTQGIVSIVFNEFQIDRVDNEARSISKKDALLRAW